MTDQRQRQQSESDASQLGSALDRVREMRDHADWPPLIHPANIQQRAERLGEVRKQITIPPLASERDLSKKKFDWLKEFARPFIYGSSAILLVSLLFVRVFDEMTTIRPVVVPFPEHAVIAFPLPERYPYATLTQSEAVGFATRAIALAIDDLQNWSLEPHTDLAGQPVYIRRGSDHEGTVKFAHAKDFSAAVYITVKLDSEAQCVVCTIHP